MRVRAVVAPVLFAVVVVGVVVSRGAFDVRAVAGSLAVRLVWPVVVPPPSDFVAGLLRGDHYA